MAWDKLKELEGGPVHTLPESVTVSMLNRESIDANCLPNVGALGIAGLIGDGVLDEIETRMGQMAGSPKPVFLPARGSLPDDAVIAYAYLARTLRFETPFKALRSGPFSGSHGEVKYFGVDQAGSDLEVMTRQRTQIRVLWHRFAAKATIDKPQECVIELVTAEKDDQLLLAMVSPGYTLRETIDMVLRHVKHLDTKKTVEYPSARGEQERSDALAGSRDPSRRDRIMGLVSGCSSVRPDEDVRIPSINMDLVKRVDELIGLYVVARSGKLNKKLIIDAEQRIRFRLDETGADLKSQAKVVLFGDGGMRDFSFARPFLVLAMRKRAKTPYFAAWIGNSELLVKAGKETGHPATKDSAGQAPVSGGK